MKAFILFITLFTNLNLLAQDGEGTYEDLHQQLRQRMLKNFEEHEEMMSEMDSLVDQLMKESFGARPKGLFKKQFSVGGVETLWSETDKGRILTIKPKSKDVKLDVQIEKGVIHIKTESSSENSRGHYSQSQSVPYDCDGDQVEMKAEGKNLVVHFPWKKEERSDQDKKKFRKSEIDV
jgi:hypothetical protein